MRARRKDLGPPTPRESACVLGYFRPSGEVDFHAVADAGPTVRTCPRRGGLAEWSRKV